MVKPDCPPSFFRISVLFYHNELEGGTMVLFTSATFSFEDGGVGIFGCWYVKNKSKETSDFDQSRFFLVSCQPRKHQVPRLGNTSQRFIFLIHFHFFFSAVFFFIYQSRNLSSQETAFGNLGCVQLAFVIVTWLTSLQYFFSLCDKNKNIFAPCHQSLLVEFNVDDKDSWMIRDWWKQRKRWVSFV